jgi:hypothetical protein
MYSHLHQYESCLCFFVCLIDPSHRFVLVCVEMHPFAFDIIYIGTVKRMRS